MLFAPEVEPEAFREDNYCGMFCKDKRLVLIILLIGFPSLMLFFYLFFRM